MPAILRGALLASLTPLSVPVSSDATVPTKIEQTVPSPFRGSFGGIPKLDCGDALGSGVRISDDIVLTARHVVQAPSGAWRKCSIDGQPAEIVNLGDGVDFAAVRVTLGPGIRQIISCEGVHLGERYQAMGYALGGPPNVEPLIGTDEVARDGRVHLRGRIFPGMSGGALNNEEGATVAILVQYNPNVDHAIVVPLTKTYLCAHK